ncbi:MAG: hypothetical protein K8I00_01750, partial [Candidatus Omnitrophica bacterium]|nr:hypothetical protein [Candidatus Omnitrophota bacterium]
GVANINGRYVASGKRSRIPYGPAFTGYELMRMFNFVHIALILTGIVLRIGYFLTGRPLSVSETHYAANIFGRSYREILYHLQILPDQPLNALGFYLAEKTVTDLLGHSADMLRLYPLVCALLGLLLFAYLSRCYLTSFGATMALGFFTLSEWLIVTGAMVSPYASDVLIGLLAVFVFEQVRRAEFRPRGMLSLTILGAVSLWFSYAAIFVWLAMLICLTDQIISLRYVRRVPSLMGLISVWMFSFLSLYLVCLSNLIQSPYAWYRLQVSFSPAPYWSVETLLWTMTAFLQVFEHPVDFAFPLLGAIFFLAGAAGLVKRNPEFLMILILPVFLTMLFGSYRLY